MALSRLQKAEGIIAKQEEELRTANLKALNHIKWLASKTKLDIKSLDIFKVFAKADSETSLIDDKRKINDKFMALYETLRAKAEKSNAKKDDSVSLEDLDGLKEAITKNLMSFAGRRKSELEQNLRNYMQRSKDYQARADSEILNVMKTRAELLTLVEPSTDPIFKDLNEVLEAGYWTNPVMDGQFLYLNTASNIIITHQKKKAAMEVSVDLGKLSVRLNMRNFGLEVIPYKDNRRCQNHYHPNVTPDGGICWGNGQDRRIEWMSQLQVGKVLELLYTMLTHYSPDNPYVPIEAFNTNSAKYGRIADHIKHPDRKKKAEKKVKAEEVKADESR